MGVFTRFKRDRGGFRKIVAIWETTPVETRQRMIEAGMSEDMGYALKIQSYMLSFQDVLELPEAELAEVLANSPPRLIAYAISNLSKEEQYRFIRCSPMNKSGEIRDFIEAGNIPPRDVGAGRLKLIEVTRLMEEKGYVKTKKIPMTP